MNRKQFLLGRPVIIASHASPAHRLRAGEVVALAGNVATVRLKTPRGTEDVAVPLQGLRLIRRPAPPAPRRTGLSAAIRRAAHAAFQP